MPSDLLIMMTVAANLAQNNSSFVAGLPFLAATVLVAALPVLFYLLFRRRAEQLMPKVSDWDEQQRLGGKHHRLRGIHRDHHLRVMRCGKEASTD
jgi:membrane protein implicated in regulation of membrane protease activity